MSWNKAMNFGVVKIEGNKVKLYESTINYDIIRVNEKIKDARWVNNAIVLSLEGGKVRRYTSFDRYITV